MNYQYFVQIVPTDIQTLIGRWPAFQYSVKEQAREVGNYAMGSSGIPGKLFCKCFMCPTYNSYFKTKNALLKTFLYISFRNLFQIRHLCIQSHSQSGSRIDLAVSVEVMLRSWWNIRHISTFM